MPYACESEGLHLPPIPEALNRGARENQLSGRLAGSLTCDRNAVCVDLIDTVSEPNFDSQVQRVADGVKSFPT